MRILRNGRGNLEKIIRKKNVDGMCRLSGFVFLHDNGKKLLAKHTITAEVIELTPDEYDLLSELKNGVKPAEQIRSMGLGELLSKRYIVGENYVEKDHYNDILAILRIMRTGKQKGMSKYTILPTTACNARCAYCFEYGFVPETMTHETADRLVDYIMKTKQDGKIRLEWFGGEPTVARDIITYICNQLASKGVEYTSAIVTNGSLIGDELAEEAVNLWHLKRAQVSVDGKRSDYELRKAYPDKRFTYDVVMDNIARLADRGVRVSLRCNLDRTNIGGAEEFFDDIYERFGKYENVSIYLAPLHQEMKLDSITSLHQSIMDLYDLVEGTPKGKMFNTQISRGGMRYNYCFSDAMDLAVIIMPDGSFTNCENLPAGHNWGNVTDGITDKELYEKLKNAVYLDDKCSACCFLPECTASRRSVCPVINDRCYECKVIDTVYELDHLKITGDTAGSDDDVQIEDDPC